MSEGDGPFLVETGNGLTIRYHGRNLYAPAAPAASARKRASTQSVEPQTLVFLPSPLLFYGVDTLLANAKSDVYLLCVEVDQQLMRLSVDNSPDELLHHPSLAYIRTDSVDEVLQALHRAGISRFRRAAEIVLNGGSSANRTTYSRMFRAVEHEIQSFWRNRMTLMHMSHLWIKNFFANLASISAAGDLAKLEVDRPIVVTGAGESLEAAAPLLQALRQRYYLLSVDTAVRSLTELGLTPDAVAVLDAQYANLDDLVGFDARGVALVADITAYPECVRRFTGERWFFFSDFAATRLFDRARAAGLLPTAVPPLGSIGVTALYCAMSMTNGPVFFAGLDFSFRPGKTHARGAPTHLMRLRRSGRLSPVTDVDATLARPHRVVEDKSGIRVWTDNSLSAYSNSLDIFVEGRGRVYDIGKTGLPNSAPLVTDLGEVQRLLTAGSKTSPWPASHSSSGRVAERRKRSAAARRFLKDERRRIERAVSVSMQAIDTGRFGDGAPEILRARVRELDYVYLHFPDWSETPSLTEGFLKRFIEAAESRAAWIDRGLALLI